ncbi:hypothetical protein CDAR_517751 [Caerostris darwini]|uniref:Uncharacterized protein n=1 Tax=Caerostris darwini TaxID=1538125 RepID=A0AAV4SAT8_9ARAC|nr:hypothetical protein CDAR_517751 [Caerostris darwini]
MTRHICHMWFQLFSHINMNTYKKMVLTELVECTFLKTPRKWVLPGRALRAPSHLVVDPTSRIHRYSSFTGLKEAVTPNQSVLMASVELA